ncbi:MAG: MATE family efflux transporter [Ignavibacteriaceae bacterium]
MRTIKGHIKETMNLAYPVIIGQLGTIMMGVVDSIMVGEIGAVPLAAASLANSIFMLVFILGLGVSIALTPLVAISVGARKFDDCGILFRQSFIINMTLAVILAIIMFLASDMIQYFNQPPDVAAQARSYAKLLGMSILPIMLFHTYKQFIEGFSVMRPAMVVTLTANIVNAFTNWVLIYGNLGFPALGLDGAGWATFASRCFLGVSLMIYVMKNRAFKQYDVSFKFSLINFPVIKKILALGLPSGFQLFFEVGAFSFAVIMVGWLGTEQLAAHQIALNLASISFMSALGISAAGSIRVGNAVGMKSILETRRAGFSAILSSAGIMTCFGIVFIILRRFLPSLYIDDKAVISLASSLLVITALFQISDGVQAVGIGILRGLTDVKAPTLITFVSYWILALPIGYLLGFKFNMGVVGVWAGLLIGLTSSAVLLTLRFNKKSKGLIEV